MMSQVSRRATLRLRIALASPALSCCILAGSGGLPAGATAVPATMTGTASAQATTVGGSWGTSRELSLAGESGKGSVVSCASPANCALADGIVLVSEVNGTWGQSQQVPGLAALDQTGTPSLTGISCPAASNCSAVGDFSYKVGDVPYSSVFLVDEIAGAWRPAHLVPGLVALNAGRDAVVAAAGLSCAAPGDCAVGGSYTDVSGGQHAFVASEAGAGQWGNAAEVAGTTPVTTIGWTETNAVSCAAPGECAAGGATDGQAFVATDKGGAWGTAQPIPGLAGISATSVVTTVACTSPGNCVAGGTYYEPGADNRVAVGFVVTESGGAWGSVQPFTGLGESRVESLSCASAGNCAAVGTYYSSYVPPSGYLSYHVFVANEAGGAWGGAQQIPGTDTTQPNAVAWVSQVSCSAPGTCSVGGGYTGDRGDQGFIADETGGTWGSAVNFPGTGIIDSGTAGVSSVSCSLPGNCTAVGYYLNVSATQPFVAERTWAQPTSTVLTLPAPTVTYGREQSERVSVAVTPSISGTATGTVVVEAGSVSVCMVTLSAGHGSCTLAATKLNTGTVKLTASYGGARGFGSSSASKSLTITKAAAKATLSLSQSSVAYGHENSERLSVLVSPEYAGAPLGTVTVTSGSVTVCVIGLAAGKGSCVLAASKLAVGTHSLIARYAGSGDFLPSTSPSKTLTVTK